VFRYVTTDDLRIERPWAAEVGNKSLRRKVFGGQELVRLQGAWESRLVVTKTDNRFLRGWSGRSVVRLPRKVMAVESSASSIAFCNSSSGALLVVALERVTACSYAVPKSCTVE
jgi:hypothetical protein